jgi:hypothetical protein
VGQDLVCPLSEKFPEEVKVRQIKRCLLKAVYF